MTLFLVTLGVTNLSLCMDYFMLEEENIEDDL
jgi:hypothetical protein